MSRVPIRMRVAAAFAVAMAVVLVGTGWYLYSSLATHLANALDRELRLRAYDLETVVRDPDASLASATNGRFVEKGESYAQLVSTNGAVVEFTHPLGKAPVLTPAELNRAVHHVIFGNRSAVPGLDEPSRFLAAPFMKGGTKFVLVVGATRENRAETLASLRDELLIAGPIALLLYTCAW
ncbi:MAG: hypothetical protein ACRDQC_15120 [Gaiellales bacterium]